MDTVTLLFMMVMFGCWSMACYVWGDSEGFQRGCRSCADQYENYIREKGWR